MTGPASCTDAFTAQQQLPFPLVTFAPANSSGVAVGVMTTAAVAYLQLRPAASAAVASSQPPEAQNLADVARNTSLLRDAALGLYGALGVNLSRYVGHADPLLLQPLQLIGSAVERDRQLGVALLAAHAQVLAYVGLGVALLDAASSMPGSGVQPLGAERAAQLVAAEGVEQLLAAAAAAQLQAMSSPPPPPPPSPSPSPSPSSSSNGTAADAAPEDMSGRLNSTELVRAMLLGAAGRAGGLALPPAATNATALVISGLAQYAEAIKAVALRELAGVPVGLNALNALVALARLAAVQADAQAQVGPMVVSESGSGSGTANAAALLDTYILDALPERVSKAAVDVGAIHALLGLPAPAPALAADGVAHVVGPLSGCSGQSNELWAPGYEPLTTDVGTGRFTLAAKGLGLVTVSPYRRCYDALTQLPLNLSVTVLTPAGAQVSLSPLATLTQVGGRGWGRPCARGARCARGLCDEYYYCYCPVLWALPRHRLRHAHGPRRLCASPAGPLHGAGGRRPHHRHGVAAGKGLCGPRPAVCQLPHAHVPHVPSGPA